MRNFGPVAILAALFAAAPASASTNAPDGTLLSSKPCPANPIRNYEDYLRSARAELEGETAAAAKEGINMPAISDARLRASLPSRSEVEDHIAYRGFECRLITYASGGLEIAGLLWKPAEVRGKRLPVVIALRGGSNKFGAMEPWRYWGWHDFLKAGYVVLATQYRGGPGSEGADGFGSKGDLDDVRALVPLARSLGYVDADRAYIHGGSRGGMQAYVLARSGFPLKAMAIRAGVTDLRRAMELRPTLKARHRDMTDFAGDPEGAMDRRSAKLWAHEIKVPTIIFHGTDDWRVPVSDALEVGEAYRKGGTRFEMHLYEGDTHDMLLNQEDMIVKTIAFFDRHR